MRAPDSRWEVIKEFFQRMPTLNVIDQRLNRDARTDEHWGATHDIRIGVNDRRFLRQVSVRYHGNRSRWGG
jgi:hypothetical protein